MIAKIIMNIISHLPSNKPSSQASFPHWYPNHPIIIILIGFLVLDKKTESGNGPKTESHKIFCKSFTIVDEWQMGSSSSLSRSPSSRSARSTEWAWAGSRMITNAMLLSAVTAYTTYTSSTAVTVYTACTVADMPTYMFRALGWYGLWALEQNVGLDGLTGWYPFDGYDYKSTCDAKNRKQWRR